MIYVVTGANYGDEGKGQIVSYLANKHSKADVLVLRHNGGAQAQHRVVLPDGRSFIFGHIGAGALTGASTFLSEFFITNPLVLAKELKAYKILQEDRDTGGIFISSKSRITTVFDMMYNQINQANRDHGTCGIGVRSTIERNEVIPFNINMYINGSRENILCNIKDYYMHKLISNGHSTSDIREMDKLDPKIFANEMLKCFGDGLISFVDDDKGWLNRMYKSRTWIFEGSQGLAISQTQHGEFPNVTPSTVGILNAEAIMSSIDISNPTVEYIYVTRSYLTRHGNGKFNEERVVGAEDKFNKNNEYQGPFKYANMSGANHADMFRRIDSDLSKSILPYAMRSAKLAVTCLDQVYTPTIISKAGLISMGESIDRVYENDTLLYDNESIKKMSICKEVIK